MQVRYVTAMLLMGLFFSCQYTGNQATIRTMVTIMDSIRAANDDIDNPFCAHTRLKFLDSLITQVSANHNSMRMEYDKANALLQEGDEQQAFDILKKMLLQYNMRDPMIRTQIMKSLGIAALRLGERQNCTLGHSAESCIMPVKGTGVHRNTVGSSQAIEVYAELLRQNPGDLESRWLMNIGYMTLGKYPAEVPAEWLIPGLDKDPVDYGIKPFKDIAPLIRLDIRNRAGGMLVEDFNNDGKMDIVNSDWDPGEPMHFFKNNGNGTFMDISAPSGIGAVKGGLNMVQADYNNDGFMDILLLRGGWMPGKYGRQPNSLLKNNGNETFTDVTLESGLFSLHPTQTAVWRDFNNDGWLDIFIGNETAQPDDPHPCELYMNDQHGHFTEMAAKAGCNSVGFVKGVTASDYNNDGFIDIFISTMNGNRILLKNKGPLHSVPQFEDVTHAAGLDKDVVRTFPTWFWDYDNDGWPDIFVCGYEPNQSMAFTLAAQAMKTPGTFGASKMYLYHNNHDGSFTNVAEQAGLNMSVFAMGSNFGDIDNDGYLDMYLGTGNPQYTSLMPNKLFKNMDGKKFADITVAARVGNLQKGHGVAFTDIDADGDQDIFTETGGAFAGDAYFNSLYLNPAQNTNHWIYIDCRGTKSNRNAIGSRLEITFKDHGIERKVYRDVNSGGSFGCSPLRREIGVGSAEIIDKITITWAGSRTVQTFTNILPNQHIVITEGNNRPENATLTRLDFESVPQLAFPCAPITRK